MTANPLMFVGTSDLAGRVRGKAFPTADLHKRQKRGVGWTPTNVQITCFDTIAESPFGAFGDLLLIPDPETEITVDFADGMPKERLVLGDIRTLDGAPWEFCTRGLLKSALARLKRLGGVDLVAAFEHEFQFRDRENRKGDAYSFAGFSRKRAFAETLMGAIHAAGLGADTIMKEYGPDQYEVTVRPEHGVGAADAAVLLRELAYMTGRRMETEVTFTPIGDPSSVGNGVHVHLSFVGEDGEPKTHDAEGPGGMSALTGAFAAGVLRYLDSIIALTAPSAISYLRLTPHRWSAAYNNLGFRDREAALRICPVTAADPTDIARQFNIEFRAADAAASPHLALAAIVHAGAQGIEDGLEAPAITEEDVSLLDEAALTARGLVRLPQSLEEALDRFGANETVAGWFPDAFVPVYLAHKRNELEVVGEMTVEARCEAYRAIY